MTKPLLRLSTLALAVVACGAFTGCHDDDYRHRRVHHGYYERPVYGRPYGYAERPAYRRSYDPYYDTPGERTSYRPSTVVTVRRDPVY